MLEFQTSAVVNSYTPVSGLDFDSINVARGKCRDACDAVKKCVGFYFQGRTGNKEKNVCNLYSTCETSQQNWAVGSMYTRVDDETMNCCKPLTVCGDNQFDSNNTSIDGTATSDRRCKDHTQCKKGEEFEVGAPSATKDRVCKALTQCKEGEEFEVGAPSARKDRMCKALTQCKEGEEFEVAAPSETKDRVCKAYTTSCGEAGDKWLDLSTKSSTSDATCTLYTMSCPDMDKQYLDVTTGGLTTDHTCKPLTECQPNEFEEKEKTATTDRKCKAYKTSCDAKDQWLDVSTKTSTTDATCRNYTAECEDDNQYLDLSTKSDTSDATCTSYKTSCEEGKWLDFGTPTKDRECKDYTTSCPESFYLDESTKSSTADATCLPKKAPGGKCTKPSMCVSGNCINGTCVCKEGHYCPGLREVFQTIIDEPEPAVLLGFGKTCTSPDQCASGNCNQGSCCNKGLVDANCVACGYGNGWCSECRSGYTWREPDGGGKARCLPVRPKVNIVTKTPKPIQRSDKPRFVGRSKNPDVEPSGFLRSYRGGGGGGRR